MAVMVTMFEQVCRYTLIALAVGKEAVAVTGAILSALLADLLDANACFSHPYHPWKQGLNEKTNGQAQLTSEQLH